MLKHPMTLRLKFILYLVFLHIILAGALGYVLWQVEPLWIIALELGCVLSLWWAVWLFQKFYEPLRLLKSSADFLRETDFSTTLLPTGQIETDALVSVYNTMLTTLRAERIRVEEKGILLQMLINASPIGIVLCNEAMVLLSANPALSSILGLNVQDAIGKPLDTALSAFAEPIKRLKTGDSALVSDKARRYKVQKALFVEKGVPHLLIMIEELTAELRATEKTAYQRIIRVLAHEVNNSIGAARSLMESALHYERYFVSDIPQDERTDFREALSIASERLSDLGAFMRDYAHVVRLPALKLQRCIADELLMTTATLFGEACKAHDIALHVVAGRRMCVILADRVQMQQALTNLVKNAVEALEDAAERTLTLSVRREESLVIISVDDTGKGLRAEDAEHFGTPFFTTKETGQGIGLMLVREIAAAHGFDFSLENRKEGGARAELRCLAEKE
jgi:two-component system nitrogen regulation sensor histidine kinase NtrY